MSTKTLTLTIVSNVHSSNDVFDNLVLVRREDTGEEGYLLCSHCCKWPPHLVNKAKWLEGCFTPKSFKDDPRLLMGYHPDSITKWSVQDKILTLQVNETKRELYEGLEVDFYMPATRLIYNPDNTRMQLELPSTMVKMFPRRANYVRRLWEIAGEGRDINQQILAFYRMVDATPMPLWVKRVAVYHLDANVQERILETVDFTRPIVERSYCEEYVNALLVVQEGEGFAKAQSITNLH